MRILVLNERDPRHPRSGGAETHVHEIFRRLSQRGHAVTLLCSHFRGAAPREELDGVTLQRVGRVPLHYPRAARACARATRRGEFDVVVDCLNKLPYLAPLYSNAPVLGLCHHLFGATAFRQVSPPVAAAVWLAERAIPRAFRNGHLVAISESTRDDLVARGLAAERIEVQHPGIRRPEVAGPAIGEREPWVVVVGRLEAYKRVDWLFGVLQRVVARLPSVRLAVVGRGTAEASLRRRARQLGLEERVTFTGFVSDAERDAWLARARVSVCASTKEGFGLTVIEANALGTPNVTTLAPGLRDTVRHGETGYLVPAHDAEAFAEHLLALLTDDALWERLSRAGLAWAQRFDWERAADAMQQSLESVVRSGGARERRASPAE